MVKTVLIATSDRSHHLVCELPYLFKKGGYHVTMMAFPHWTLTHSSYIDVFIKTGLPSQVVIEDVANLLQKQTFDLIILGTDRLIWSLVDSSLDPIVKAKLFPIRNLEYIYALDGKVGVAKVCDELHILSPAFRIAKSKDEACSASKDLGFPLMLKISRSGGGDGVCKVDSIEELLKIEIPFNPPVLLQEYIEGDLFSAEPFFQDSELIAYGYSSIDVTTKPFEPSIQRTFFSCPEVEPILQKLGREFEMNGFANISFIRERKSGKLYLIEVDFRPNRWVRYSMFAGVNWIKAIQNPSSTNVEKPTKTRHLRHFPEDFLHAFRTKNMSSLMYWFFNRNRGWQVMPFYDPSLFFHGICKMVRKLLRVN